MTPAEIVERVLAEHAAESELITTAGWGVCSCGWEGGPGQSHREHLIAAVVEALGEAEVQWGVRYLPPYPDTTTAGFPMPSERHARELVADSVGEAVVVHRSRIVGPWVEDGA